MSFAKVDSGIIHSTIWVQPHDVLRVWIWFLTQCDQAGFVRAAAPAIALACMVDVARCREILELLEAPDPDSRSEAEEGRRIQKFEGGWQIINYAQYRKRVSEEEKREADRVRIAEKRAASRSGSPPVDDCRDVSRPVADVAQAEAEGDISPSLRSGEARKRATPTRAITSIKGIAVPDKPEGVAPQTWSDWLGLRKAKSAPVTETVVNNAQAEAEKARLPLTRFLEIWCARGSQGLQADWLKPNELAHARAGPNGQQPKSKTLTAIQKLQGMKRGNVDPQRDSGRPDQAALLGS